MADLKIINFVDTAEREEGRWKLTKAVATAYVISLCVDLIWSRAIFSWLLLFFFGFFFFGYILVYLRIFASIHKEPGVRRTGNKTSINVRQ